MEHVPWSSSEIQRTIKWMFGVLSGSLKATLASVAIFHIINTIMVHLVLKSEESWVRPQVRIWFENKWLVTITPLSVKIELLTILAPHLWSFIQLFKSWSFWSPVQAKGRSNPKDLQNKLEHQDLGSLTCLTCHVWVWKLQSPLGYGRFPKTCMAKNPRKWTMLWLKSLHQMSYIISAKNIQCNYCWGHGHGVMHDVFIISSKPWEKTNWHGSLGHQQHEGQTQNSE